MKTVKASPSWPARILVWSAAANLVAGIVTGDGVRVAVEMAYVATIAYWVLDNAARSRRLIGIIAALRPAPARSTTPCPRCGSC
jgi:hypothetical protein